MSFDRIVLGTAGLGGVWGPVDPAESVRTILSALESGITAIDTAPAYGDAERYVGQALQQWKGSLPRVSTKTGRLKGFSVSEGYYDFSKEGMLRSAEQSLQVLGLQKLDILFLHDPKHMDENQAGRAVETLQLLRQMGYATKLGLGGNPPAFFDPYIRSGVFDVLMEFNKLNACNITAIDEYLPFCNQHHIQYFNASPLYMGLLGERYLEYTTNPPGWIDRETFELAAKLNSLGEACGIPMDALAHRFLLSFPYEFDIVIGAANNCQLQQTINAFSEGPLPVQLDEIILRNINRKNN
jgi:aryl-alcohol dehydrogenase-like predicted oxidoreductase